MTKREEELEEVRRLHLVEGKEAKEIQQHTGLPLRKVYRLFKKLGDQAKTPLKAEITSKMAEYLRESLEDRDLALTELREILRAEPRIVMVKDQQITIDNSALKIGAAKALVEIRESKDKLIGLVDSEILGILKRIEQEVARTSTS